MNFFNGKLYACDDETGIVYELKEDEESKNFTAQPWLLLPSAEEGTISVKIPTLKNFISFPTTVFLNKKHEVVKVHAGFNGPATGKFFDEWKVEFEKDVEGILK